MHTEPIRHHYIPQFILRNFCFEDKRLYYFDKQTGCISVKDAIKSRAVEVIVGVCYTDSKTYLNLTEET